MTLPFATRLTHRSLIRIGGADRLGFLQGLLSNDISAATSTRAVHAALLTPQGKFLHDMFVLESGDSFLLDCEAARAEDLIRRLMAYKLRSKVTFENLADAYDVWAIWNSTEESSFRRKPESIFNKDKEKMDPRLRGDDGFFFTDPRLPELGARVFVPKDQIPEGITQTDFASYDTHRLSWGVADGSRDMEIEKSTLAEGNFDFLNGIDWKKGCYVGQELTARMHYRALVKKRFYPVRIEGESLAFGTNLDGESGEMRSSCGNQGLALLRIEAVRKSLDEKNPLTYGNIKLWPFIPAWMKLT